MSRTASHLTSTDIKVLQLASLDLKGVRTLMVPLPTGEAGRVRVAFVPLKDDWLLSGAGLRSLRAQLLQRCP